MSPPRSACRPCARAKARCIYDPPTSSHCLRCDRIGKECIPQDASKRRPMPIRKSRVDRLEKEVEALHSALESQNIIQRDVRSNIHVVDSSSNQILDRGKGTGTGINDKPSVQTDLRPQHSLQTTYDPEIWPGDAEAESLVLLYCKALSTHFPFVMPPTQPVADTRRDRPFLFKAMIMAATYQNRPLQHKRGSAFTREVATGLLVDGIKNLDLLQGLLVHLTWYHCYLQASSQITNLLQLAIALLADLGLNKPGHFNDRRKPIFDASRSSYGFSTNIRILSNDERRALLGCFYISSMISTFFRRVNALDYTAYMARELQELLASAEYPTDQLLGHLIRVQSEVENIGKAVPYDQPTHSDYGSLAMMTSLRMLHQRLCDLHEILSLKMKSNDLLLLQHHASSIFVHEVGLYDEFWQAETSAFQRLNTMSLCLKGSKSFFNCFLSLSPHSITTLPYSIWCQLAYALLIASRLSLVLVEGWDSDLVRQELSFCDILDRLTNKLTSINRLYEPDVPDSVLSHVCVKLERIKGWFTSQNTPKDTLDCYPPMDTFPSIWQNDGLSGDFWEDLINCF